jgi:chromosome segregation ATPase
MNAAVRQYNIGTTSGQMSYVVETSSVDSATLERLDALARTGMMGFEDLVSVLGPAEDGLFVTIAAWRAMQPPDDLPLEDLPLDDITMDLSSMLAMAQALFMQLNQTMRQMFMKLSLAEREQMMAKAVKAHEFDLKAAEENYAAASMSAWAEIASGITSCLFAAASARQTFKAHGNGKTMSKAQKELDVKQARLRALDKPHEDLAKAKATQKSAGEKAYALDQDIQALEQQKAELHSKNKLGKQTKAQKEANDKAIQELDNKIVLKRQERDAEMNRAEGAGKEVARLEKEIKDNELSEVTERRNLETDIKKLERQAHRAGAKSDRNNRLAQLWTQLGAGLGQVISGLMKLQAAASSYMANVDTADSKLTQAEQEQASMRASQLAEFASDCLQKIGQILKMIEEMAQQTKGVSDTVARNIGA